MRGPNLLQRLHEPTVVLGLGALRDRGVVDHQPDRVPGGSDYLDLSRLQARQAHRGSGGHEKSLRCGSVSPRSHQTSETPHFVKPRRPLRWDSSSHSARLG
jgi:hypothetical protein